METLDKNPLQSAIDELGSYKVAKLCAVKGPSVCKWRAKGRLPRTEWTGETDYATVISNALDGRISRAQLLQLPGVIPAVIGTDLADQVNA